MTAYYNEIDAFAAEWLRNLISSGHIAPGDVDTRSIEDVLPSDLAGYTQCHFFAGIGVWSYALRLSGWPDARPVWTGSCPCQPFSAAGKGAGTADERHLWPAWFHLIEQCRPSVIFGEQVEAAIRHGWLDLVQADMEGIGYAFAAAGVPAAGVGAPHIRHRLWFVSERMDYPAGARCGGEVTNPKGETWDEARVRMLGERIKVGRLGEPNSSGREPRREGSQTARHRGAVEPTSCFGGLADTVSAERPRGQARVSVSNDTTGRQQGSAETTGFRNDSRPGPTNGFWREADWLGCRDGKWRPVEPGTFPLAHGPASRVGRLRAYGNAIVPQVAEAVIRAYLES